MGSNNDTSMDVTEIKTEADNLGFFYDLISAPCFRQSALYGIGGGAAIATLNFVRNRDALRSAETMVKTGCGISALTWVLCRRQYYLQREMTYESMEKYKQQKALRAVAHAKAMREKHASSTAHKVDGEGNSD